MGHGPHLALVVLAALAFATGALVIVAAVRVGWRFRRMPEFVLKHLLQNYLGGRAVYLCNACPNVHLVPPLRRHRDGTPDWEASRADDTSAPAMQALVHEGPPLQVIVRRIAAREGLTMFGVIAKLMTRQERENALGAFCGECADDLVDAVVDDDFQRMLEEALVERNDLEASGLLEPHAIVDLRAEPGTPYRIANLDDIAGGRDPLGAEQLRKYIALLTPRERARLMAALSNVAAEPHAADSLPAGSTPAAALPITERNSP